MDYTSNLNLKKPQYTDVVDIADFNDNFDAIDEKLTTVDTTISDLSIYDVVIRTQEEFEELYASDTWLDAVSVCFVGDGGTLIFTSSSGCEIPATVKNIKGINNAIIEVTSSAPSGSLFYTTLPDIDDGYWIDGMTVKCSSFISQTYCFCNCVNLTNCTSINTNNSGGTHRSYGFNDCVNLTNCTSTATGHSTGSGNGYGYGFYECTNLSNCTGTATGSSTDSNHGYGYGYGFYECTNLNNCTGTATGEGCVYASGDTNTAYGYGYCFYECTNLSNCTGTATGEGKGIGTNSGAGVGLCFYNCSCLSNCVGTGTGIGISTGTGTGTSTGYGFSGCSYMSNCTGSATTAILYECTNVDSETVEGATSSAIEEIKVNGVVQDVTDNAVDIVMPDNTQVGEIKTFVMEIDDENYVLCDGSSIILTEDIPLSNLVVTKADGTTWDEKTLPVEADSLSFLDTYGDTAYQYDSSTNIVYRLSELGEFVEIFSASFDAKFTTNEYLYYYTSGTYHNLNRKELNSPYASESVYIGKTGAYNVSCDVNYNDMVIGVTYRDSWKPTTDVTVAFFNSSKEIIEEYEHLRDFKYTGVSLDGNLYFTTSNYIYMQMNPSDTELVRYSLPYSTYTQVDSVGNGIFVVKYDSSTQKVYYTDDLFASDIKTRVIADTDNFFYQNIFKCGDDYYHYSNSVLYKQTADPFVYERLSTIEAETILSSNGALCAIPETGTTFNISLKNKFVTPNFSADGVFNYLKISD